MGTDSRPAGTGDASTPPHILVVDDEPEILAVVCEALALEGYAVTAAPDAAAALHAAAARHPDLAIVDLMMPAMDGWALRAALRERAPELPVVFMSARSDVRAQAAGHGAIGYLAKPFDISRLVEAVEFYLGAAPGGRSASGR